MIALGARLVADDRVRLGITAGRLEASAPAPIAGLIEARGVGLLRVAVTGAAEVVLAVDLDRVPAARMPQCDRITYLGRNVRLISGRDVPNLDAILTILLDNFQLGPD
jgi:HPr kinase/phosphorylase